MYMFVQLSQALAYEVHELMKVINSTYLLIPQTNNDAQGWCMLRHFPAVIIENIYVRGQEPDLGGGGGGAPVSTMWGGKFHTGTPWDFEANTPLPITKTKK